MDAGVITAIILTGVGSVAAIIGCNVALIGWIRSDLKAFEAEVRGWREEMHKETKDFHGKLCGIDTFIKNL